MNYSSLNELVIFYPKSSCSNTSILSVNHDSNCSLLCLLLNYVTKYLLQIFVILMKTTPAIVSASGDHCIFNYYIMFPDGKNAVGLSKSLCTVVSQSEGEAPPQSRCIRCVSRPKRKDKSRQHPFKSACMPSFR